MGLNMNKGVTLLKELNESVASLIQEVNLTYDDLKRDISFFIHILDKIPDYREQYRVSYSLTNLIMISLILIMMNEFKSFHYAADCIHVYKNEFEEMGLIKNGQIPSHDTLRRMFMLLDAQKLKESIIDNLNNFLTTIVNNYSSSRKVELISIDGKEFRGSGRSVNTTTPIRNKNVLNVYNVSKEICIYSNPLDDKDSEIKEAQGILNKYNLKKTVVTGDALHCQKSTCQVIINKGGNYVFTVKENQTSLLEEIKSKIESSNNIDMITYNDCTYKILTLPPSYIGLEFPGQKSYVMMTSHKRKKQSLNKINERFFITSLKDNPLIVEAIDNRWKIENDLHKFKDDYFEEDSYTFTDKNAIKVMATLNNIAYSFFRITVSFLNEKRPNITKIKFKKNPIEVLEKITPLLNSRDFSKQLKEHLKGIRSK